MVDVNLTWLKTLEGKDIQWSLPFNSNYLEKFYIRIDNDIYLLTVAKRHTEARFQNETSYSAKLLKVEKTILSVDDFSQQQLDSLPTVKIGFLGANIDLSLLSKFKYIVYLLLIYIIVKSLKLI